MREIKRVVTTAGDTTKMRLEYKWGDTRQRRKLGAGRRSEVLKESQSGINKHGTNTSGRKEAM